MRLPRSWSTIALCLLTLTASSCQKDAALAIIATSPADSSTDVPVASAVTVEFSEELDVATALAAGALKLEESDTAEPVPGSLTYANRALVFRPDTELKLSTRYTATVDSSVTSASGSALGNPFQFSFKTKLPPTADAAVTELAETDFFAGKTVLRLQAVAPTEQVTVIPINLSQVPGESLAFKVTTNGLDYSTLPPPPSAKTISLSNPVLSPHLEFFGERLATIAAIPQPVRVAANDQRLFNPLSFGKCKGPYTLGMKCSFSVLDANLTRHPITAVLRRSSTNAYWWVDETDLADLADADLARLETSYETRTVPSNSRYFGTPPDTDSNGKIFVVFSHWLIDPVATNGLLGYVDPCDLYPDGTCGTQPSNEGDIFFAVTPSRLSAFGISRDGFLNEVMPTTMTHELKHLIADGTRLLGGIDPEELWLEEPSAVAAEELAGFGSLVHQTQQYAQYALTNPGAYPILFSTRPTDYREQFSMYGFNFLMLWSIGERVGHDHFWKSWMNGPSTGIANLLSHSGQSWGQILKDWALHLLLDHTGDIPGYNYKSLNLRDGTWAKLGLQTLEPSRSASVKSLGFYSRKGTGDDATIVIETAVPSKARFLVIRH